jgi:hypothetical protein
MSTKETDQYWLAQEAIYQDFCALVDGTSYEVGRDALDKMTEMVGFPDGIAPETYRSCKEYLNGILIRQNGVDDDEWKDIPESEEPDPNVQYQQIILDKEQDDADQADMRNAPSEGFKL